MGRDTVTTTLLFSIYQDHDTVAGIGREESEDAGVEFYYEDFRVGWHEGQRRAREYSIYRQKYCGCIFSEEERYKKEDRGPHGTGAEGMMMKKSRLVRIAAAVLMVGCLAVLPYSGMSQTDEGFVVGTVFNDTDVAPTVYGPVVLDVVVDRHFMGTDRAG